MNILAQYWKMIRKTSGDKIIAGFLVFFFADCLLILWLDPSIHTYGDALWLGFNVLTSIGLGDYTVTTAPARIAVMLLGIYGAIIAAYIPGLIASWYFEKMQQRKQQIVENHKEEISRLDSMKKEERKSLSDTIRQEGKR